MTVSVWYANEDFSSKCSFASADNIPTVDLKGDSPSHKEIPLFGFRVNRELTTEGLLEDAFRHFNWIHTDGTAPKDLGYLLRLWWERDDFNNVDELKRVWHSSMSVGDMVCLDGDFYVCLSVGWEKL